MKFIISRTSVYDDTICPLQGAKKITVPYYDQSSFKSVEEHDKNFGKGSWLSRGTEHSINKVGIVRRLEDVTAWEIEINTLDELVTLQNEVGPIIIQQMYYNDRIGIEIYDEYRE